MAEGGLNQYVYNLLARAAAVDAEAERELEEFNAWLERFERDTRETMEDAIAPCALPTSLSGDWGIAYDEFHYYGDSDIYAITLEANDEMP